MKIGIFTQPLKSNYGGILQNYALQIVLKRLGHEPWTVDYLRYNWFDWSVDSIKALIKKCLGRKCKFPLLPEEVEKNETPLRKFALSNIQLTSPRVRYPNKSILQRYAFDALIVGSDQTWRPIYNGRIYDMYLRLAEGLNLKRIAYAASFGTDEWEYTKEQEIECARLAKLFDGISVREDSGVNLCNKYLSVDATHVLDPTLLLTSEHYTELCQNIEKKEPFIFAYILDIDERKKQEVIEFAKAKKLPYQIVSAGSHVSDDDSIEKWLSNFRDATYIITDSFHGTAFAVNFNKDFFVYGNEHRGNSRFNSLLDTFNLRNRMVNSITDTVESIDWEKVNKKLHEKRTRSVEWLQSKLN